MRILIITRSIISVKYKVIAISVDNLEMEADKATRSNKKRKYCNLRADEQVESQETEYVGVSWNKKNRRWIANIKIDRKSKHLGSFNNDYEAAMRYDEEARKQGEAVNFTFSNEDIQAEKPKKQRKFTSIERIERQETEYVGVSWSRQQQRWAARIRIDGRRKHLGYFDSDYDAAIKYDEEARKQGKGVNFKFSDAEVQAERRKKPRTLSANERIERQETEYVGVCWDKKNQRWHAQIQIGKKTKNLGYFDSDYDAAMKYDEEARKHGKPVNVPIYPTEIQTEKRKKVKSMSINNQELK